MNNTRRDIVLLCIGIIFISFLIFQSYNTDNDNFLDTGKSKTQWLEYIAADTVHWVAIVLVAPDEPCGWRLVIEGDTTAKDRHVLREWQKQNGGIIE